MIDLGPMNDAVRQTWGEPVTIYLFGTQAVQAVYDSRHYAVEDGEAGGSSRFTSVAVRDADARYVVANQTELQARGKFYRVTEKRADGGDWTVLALEEISGP